MNKFEELLFNVDEICKIAELPRLNFTKPISYHLGIIIERNIDRTDDAVIVIPEHDVSDYEKLRPTLSKENIHSIRTYLAMLGSAHIYAVAKGMKKTERPGIIARVKDLRTASNFSLQTELEKAEKELQLEINDVGSKVNKNNYGNIAAAKRCFLEGLELTACNMRESLQGDTPYPINEHIISVFGQEAPIITLCESTALEDFSYAALNVIQLISLTYQTINYHRHSK